MTTTENAPLAATQEVICPDTILYKAGVHYLGRRAPMPSVDGLESIQKPLCELYSPCPCENVSAKDIPRDVYLVVLASGIFVLPINPIDSKFWIRMQEFRGCGAVRGVMTDYTPDGGPYVIDFVALDSAEAASSSLPAIFTLIAARSGPVPLIDCYAFSCPDDQTALSLVTATKSAFANRNGWSMGNNIPSLTILDLDGNSKNNKKKCADKFQEDFVNPELYQKPPLNGFFYASNAEMIRSFNIGKEAEAIPYIPPVIVPEPPIAEIIVEEEPEIEPENVEYVYVKVDKKNDKKIVQPEISDVQISYQQFVARPNDNSNKVDLLQWMNDSSIPSNTGQPPVMTLPVLAPPQQFSINGSYSYFFKS